MDYRQQLLKKVAPYMKQNGYSRRGNCFYRIKNSIAFCVGIDCPTGIAYTTFFVVPLFMPAEFRYYTYGNRLNYLMPNDVRMHDLILTETTIEDWTIDFKTGMESVVFPFFNNIASPEKMAQFIETNYACQKYFFCPDIQLVQLLMFTYTFLLDWEKANMYIQKMKEQIDKCRFFTPQVLAEYLVQLNTLKSFQHQTELACAYFLDVIRETKLACFGK